MKNNEEKNKQPVLTCSQCGKTTMRFVFIRNDRRLAACSVYCAEKIDEQISSYGNRSDWMMMGVN